MSDEKQRSVRVTRLGPGRYQATNPRGGTLRFGGGTGAGGGGAEDAFTPVELLLTAIAGCSGIDVDLITSKRAEPTRFDLLMEGTKVRDEQGNRLTGLTLTF